MMNILHLISVFLVFQLYRAEDNPTPNCEVSGITDEEWGRQKVFDFVINDTAVNTKVFESPYKNIKNVSGCAEYFCIELDEETKNLSIVTRKNFSNIDGNGDHQRTDSSTVGILSTIDFTCTSGIRTLRFKINVTDTNTHPPVFSETTYKYTLPMPMSPKNNITNFGKDIIVQDIDFSNKNVTFLVNYEGLSYTTILLGNYSYQLQLQFTGVKRLEGSQEFILTVTDTGIPSLSSNATVIFNIDETNSEPPSFTKPSYLFDYDAKKSQIVARDGQKIQLESARTSLRCEIEEEDYSAFFNDVVVDQQIVILSLKKPFTNEIILEDIAQITIQCYVSKVIGISSADVIISFPQDSVTTVRFSQKKYVAEYKISQGHHEIKMSENISLTEKLEDVTITVDSFIEYIEVHEANDGWVLARKKDLNESTLKNTQINIIIELRMKNVNKSIDEAFITLFLPNGEDGIYFKQPYFIGDYEYDDSSNGTMEPINVTLNSNDFDIQSCGLEISEYSDFFTPTCPEPNKIEVENVKSLPKKLLKVGTVPLSMWVDLKLGKLERNISTAIVLNLSHKEIITSSSSISTTSTTEATPNSEGSGDCNHTVWIIAVIILLLLLVVYVTATMLYYFRRIRKRDEIDYIPQPNRITPRMKPRISDDKKYKNVSTRRPTGFIRYNPDQDGSSLDSEYGEAQIEVNNNTNANKYLNDTDETFRKKSDSSNSMRGGIEFIIPPAPPEPPTLTDELKRAVEERGRLSD